MLNEYRDLIYAALQKVAKANIDIYTFAIYHDHESGFVSICIDTKENSKNTILNANSFIKEQFQLAIENDDLDRAADWQTSGGRSFELGSFRHKNIDDIRVPINPKRKSFYLDMVKAVQEMSELIARHSSHGKNLLFCSSTSKREVGLVWSV